MPKRNTHRKFYRILLIPDDKDEPKAFSVPVPRLKYIKLLAVLLILHIILGAVFYVQYYRIAQKNQELLVINRQLEENNMQINKLMNEFNDVEYQYTKLRSVLGLGTINADQSTPVVRIPEENVVTGSIPAYQRDPRQMTGANQVRHKYGFLKRSKSPLHNYEKSVPTFLPVEGVLSKDFEDKTYTGPFQHRGVDIAAQRGEPVHAAADGVVVFSGWTYDLGNLIIINHGNGFYSYYGHNQRCLHQRGSFVKKGDIIAHLGNTGISSAPHLHFEIWRDGVALDPKEYILAFSDLDN